MGWNTRPTYAALATQFSVGWPTGDVLAGPSPVDVTAQYANILPNIGQQKVNLIDHPPGVPTPDRTLGSFPLGLGQIGVPRNPQIGVFFRDWGIVAGTIGGEGLVRHVPEYAPDGRIGRFVIGKSPLGYRRAVHRRVVPGVGAGAGETEAGQ